MEARAQHLPKLASEDERPDDSGRWPRKGLDERGNKLHPAHATNGTRFARGGMGSSAGDNSRLQVKGEVDWAVMLVRDWGRLGLGDEVRRHAANGRGQSVVVVAVGRKVENFDHASRHCDGNLSALCPVSPAIEGGEVVSEESEPLGQLPRLVKPVS